MNVYTQHTNRTRAARSRGVTVILVIVFMGIFLVILGTITSYTFMQARYGRALYAREQALQIAEGGLEYYRWFLAHYPNDLTNGTGFPGPHTYTVSDPEGGALGSASISLAANSACSVIQSIDLNSTGTAEANPIFSRTLVARYMRPSVAEYSHIVNQNVWAGSDRVITGPYHSNGGVRMDGTNNSDVTSEDATWVCDSSFGCSPTDNNAPGVFGAGPGSALWRYPASTINFENMAANFSALRGYAYNDGILLSGTTTRVDNVQQGGQYTSVADSEQRGYHLVFNGDGTVTIYRVTGTESVRGYSSSGGWQDRYDIIADQTSLGTFTPPSDCALIFVNAKTWVEGTVAGKVTVIAADLGSFTPDVILNGNLTYNTFDGSTGLTIVAERSVHIPLLSPDTMTIRGIFVAQTGQFGRLHYRTSGSNDVPSQYDSYVQQSQLTTNGSVVSNLRVGTKWICGNPGTYCSGYANRVDNYDRILAFDPPPFTPSASVDHEFVLWREK